MDFSELTIRLLLIFFPGIIAAMIIDSLTKHREREFKVFLLNSFILGLTSYFILYILLWINNLIVEARGKIPTWEVNFLENLINKNANISMSEVIISTILSIVLALLITLTINHNYLHRFAKKIKITNKFGQLDVWSYIFNSPDIDWIIIRDVDNDLMYQGWIEAFSDTYDNNELFIREVDVYRNSTKKYLYRMEGIYFSRDQNSLTLEFPKIKGKNEEDVKCQIIES